MNTNNNKPNIDNKKNLSKLDELDKVFPYDIPDGYFEEFPVKMAEKISESKNAESKTLTIRSLYKLMPAAAVIALFIITSIIFLQKSEVITDETDYSDISISEFAYLNDADIYNSDLFLELLTEDLASEEIELYLEDLLAEDILLEYYIYEDEENLKLIENY